MEKEYFELCKRLRKLEQEVERLRKVLMGLIADLNITKNTYNKHYNWALGELRRS